MADRILSGVSSEDIPASSHDNTKKDEDHDVEGIGVVHQARKQKKPPVAAKRVRRRRGETILMVPMISPKMLMVPFPLHARLAQQAGGFDEKRSTAIPFFFRSSWASLMPFVRFSPIGASGLVMELITPIFTGGPACESDGMARKRDRNNKTLFFFITVISFDSGMVIAPGPVLIPMNHGMGERTVFSECSLC
jgi:hypothetical protein